MRITVIGLNHAPEPTGIAPYTTGLARMLAADGHDVHVVTGRPHYPSWRLAPGYRGRRRMTIRVAAPPGRLRVTRVHHPVPARGGLVARTAMEAVFAVRAAGVRTRPDVVLVVSPALLSVAAGLVKRAVAGLRPRRPGRPGASRPVVGVLVQDLYGAAVSETAAGGGLGGGLGGVVGLLERALLTRADGVACVHEVLRSGLGAVGLDPRAVTVIRNWTHSVAAAAGAPTVRATRERLGWRPDEIVALHAGNMGAKQGLENVVAAAAESAHRGAGVRFVLLGDGNRRAALEAAARAGATRGALSFLDPLPDGDFEAALAAADVLVLNERAGVTEMCAPSKLTSYFDSGRPVVAATGPASAAARELGDSGAGVVVPPADPAALLAAVRALGHDRARAARLGARGRDYAASTLSSAAAARQYRRWVTALATGTGTDTGTDTDTDTGTGTDAGPGEHPATRPAPSPAGVPSQAHPSRPTRRGARAPRPLEEMS